MVFLVLPTIIWAALRFSRLVTVSLLILLCVQSFYGSYLELGFFSHDIEKTGLVNLWIFNAMIFLIGMIISIMFHERKQIEKKLELSDYVFHEAHESIMITDKNNLIVSVNPAFIKTTEYQAKEVIGKSPRILKSGKQNTLFYKEMWDKILSDGHWKGEIWNRKKKWRVIC